MTARKIAAAYLAIVLMVFLAKMVELNGLVIVLQVVGIMAALLSVMIAAIIVLSD